MGQFREFPKITRIYEQDVVVTEKIDGTNGLVFIPDDLSFVRAGSRTRWISTTDDNYGFAKWVDANAADLLKLGPGYHYGEWWGQGVQRKYGMSQKVFSLFNTHRWNDPIVRPACCDVVPTLFAGPAVEAIARFVDSLKVSEAAANYGATFENPEGVLMYFTKAGCYFKAPIEKERKGNRESVP